MDTFPVHISNTDTIFYTDRKKENKDAIGSDEKGYTFHQKFSGFLERVVGIRNNFFLCKQCFVIFQQITCINRANIVVGGLLLSYRLCLHII